jgi:hypothetical protein
LRATATLRFPPFSPKVRKRANRGVGRVRERHFWTSEKDVQKCPPGPSQTTPSLTLLFDFPQTSRNGRVGSQTLPGGWGVYPPLPGTDTTIGRAAFGRTPPKPGFGRVRPNPPERSQTGTGRISVFGPSLFGGFAKPRKVRVRKLRSDREPYLRVDKDPGIPVGLWRGWGGVRNDPPTPKPTSESKKPKEV